MTIAESIMYLIGASSALVFTCCWFSPYLCRLLAAALLTHADSIDEARKIRQLQWDYHTRNLGVAQTTKARRRDPEVA